MEVPLQELTPVPTAAEAAAAQQHRQQRQARQMAMSDSRRAMVLDAARSVFAEKGIEGASMREIARRAAYTPGAIYSYFDSKEAIYIALLSESLGRLNDAVAATRQQRSPPHLTLQAKAQAWFGFYLRNPRDLDLGLHLARGLTLRDIVGAPPQTPSARLHDALRPCEQAMQAMGLPPDAALRESAALFAHGLGLLLLHHSEGIRAFGQSAEVLFQSYVDQLVDRLSPEGRVPAPTPDQADLFGG